MNENEQELLHQIAIIYDRDLGAVGELVGKCVVDIDLILGNY